MEREEGISSWKSIVLVILIWSFQVELWRWFVPKLQVLRNHYLLASINKFGQRRYQDVTMGEMIVDYRTGLGRTDVMQVEVIVSGQGRVGSEQKNIGPVGSGQKRKGQKIDEKVQLQKKIGSKSSAQKRAGPGQNDQLYAKSVESN